MTTQNKITQIILECAPTDMTVAQIKLMTAKLMALVDEAVNHKDNELKKMWDKCPEPVNYVSSDGLLLLPDTVREKLSLQQGGGVSFIPNKNTGRFELWTIEQVDEWLSGEGETQNKYPFAVANHDDLPMGTKDIRNDNDPTLQISLSEIYSPSNPPSYDIKSINGVEIDPSENCIRVVAMAGGLCRAENGKLTKMENKPDNCVTVVDGSDISLAYSEEFTPSNKQPLDPPKIFGHINLEDLDFTPGGTPSGIHPLDPPSPESLQKMAELGIDIGATKQRQITICYGNDIDDMFIRYDDEANRWVLYNWRMVDVDKREKWLEEVRVKLFISVVVSDDKQWILYNGERSKAEKWEVS